MTLLLLGKIAFNSFQFIHHETLNAHLPFFSVKNKLRGLRNYSKISAGPAGHKKNVGNFLLKPTINLHMCHFKSENFWYKCKSWDVAIFFFRTIWSFFYGLIFGKGEPILANPKRGAMDYMHNDGFWCHAVWEKFLNNHILAKKEDNKLKPTG